MQIFFELRKELPAELAVQFEAFKDIKSIDRIRTAAWIGVALTFCLFGLDFSRYYPNGFKQHYYFALFYIHLSGLLYLIPAIHITRNRDWIIQTRLRRGIVIWGMVVILFGNLLGQALFVEYYRGNNILFLGFVFTGSWMFAMSHKERMLFFVVSLAAISWSVLNSIKIVDTDDRIVGFLEVFFLSIVAFFFDGYDYNQKLDNFLSQLQVEKERKRITELESFKSRFFTNLTHEFRTPLTTIIGMSREVAENPARWAKEGTEMIRENAGQLLNLVNQVLTISKLENGALPLYLVQGDIVSFTGYIVDSFRSHAISKNITLHFICQEDRILMDYDPDKYSALLSNLLSNAVKFSHVNENIYVSLSLKKGETNDSIELGVKDNGIGIPKEELDLIFERFYQVNNEVSASGIGTGIGLSMVRELVELLQGKIKVTSAIGKGTQFTVSLPINHNAILEEGHSIHVYEPGIISHPTSHVSGEVNLLDVSGSSEKPVILIIEDNEDVLKYLRIMLVELFQLRIARNGEEGITVAINSVPDLILSDVLMPVKDGLAVCKELKHNPVTSHIPIILLSAKSDTESRVAGLKSGADVYLTKPFEKDELRAHIQNLLNRFKEYHLRYANPNAIPANTSEIAIEVEDEFITRIRNLVHEHLDDSDFSVHDLERGVFLSRSQLHKKLKALTGLSTMQFVSRIRLSVGRDRLKTEDKTISDIAYEVGFSDPNYFSRAYSEEFGESPSETRNRHKKNGL
jgi:signal transduction histidine kinase/DNA-binding response OmpR family regulator